MPSSHSPRDEDDDIPDDAPEIFDANDAQEILPDAAMDSGDDDDDDEGIDEEIQLENDSAAHFDLHRDSIFAIAQHPLHPHIVATGGSDGDDAGGMGYIFDATPARAPLLPASYQAEPGPQARESLRPMFALEGHEDSINGLAFTLPRGRYLLSAGLDGRLRAYAAADETYLSWRFLAEAREVEEINWLAACPHARHPDTVALGANDGSVWVYTVDASVPDTPLRIVQSFFLHTASCTAGAWTADGTMLASVSEDGSLYVWDVFGDAAAAGLTQGAAGQTVVGLTAADQRFAVEGGLFSVAVAPSGAFVVVGGAGGAIKVVGLPRLAAASGPAPKSKGGKRAGDTSAASTASAGQAGQILADLHVQRESIEALAFAPPPRTLLAAGSVDGSIALYDSAHRFAVRRHIPGAHGEHAVVRVEFVGAPATDGWLLTSCGLDGVVRRWDTRGGGGASGGGGTAADSGLVAEWRGHRGDGVGVLGFVQGAGERIVTAGDDAVALVFESPVG